MLASFNESGICPALSEALMWRIQSRSPPLSSLTSQEGQGSSNLVVGHIPPAILSTTPGVKISLNSLLNIEPDGVLGVSTA